MDIKCFPTVLNELCISYLEPHEQTYYSNKWRLYSKYYVCDIAAEYGWIDLLMWAKLKNCPWGLKTSINAVQYGHLDILKWICQNNCSWDVALCARNAAAHGHLIILDWLRTQSLTQHIQNDYQSDVWICGYAALNGHLEILKWARHNNYPWNSLTCANAALNGHLEILKWARCNILYDQFEQKQNDDDVCEEKQTDALLCPWDEHTCANAATNGHFEVLKWARANNCPWNSTTCYEAASNNHLDILIWARANNCPWDVQICRNKAKYYGHLEILKWIDEITL